MRYNKFVLFQTLIRHSEAARLIQCNFFFAVFLLVLSVGGHWSFPDLILSNRTHGKGELEERNSLMEFRFDWSLMHCCREVDICFSGPSGQKFTQTFWVRAVVLVFDNSTSTSPSPHQLRRQIHFNFAKSISASQDPFQLPPPPNTFQFAKSISASQDPFQLCQHAFYLATSTSTWWVQFRLRFSEAIPPYADAWSRPFQSLLPVGHTTALSTIKVFPKLTDSDDRSLVLLLFGTNFFNWLKYSRPHVTGSATHTHRVSRAWPGCHNGDANSTWRCCTP